MMNWGPEDTSRRAQSDKGCMIKDNAHSPVYKNYGRSGMRVSHPIHLHWRLFYLRVVCRATPFFISMGSIIPGISTGRL